jgi:hypothetical protein
MKQNKIHQKLGITDYEITEKNKEVFNDLLPVLEKKHKKVMNIELRWTKQVQVILLKFR